jgi:hypothetical protein
LNKLIAIPVVVTAWTENGNVSINLWWFIYEKFWGIVSLFLDFVNELLKPLASFNGTSDEKGFLDSHRT